MILTGFGLLTALVVWLPLASRKLPPFLLIVCIARRAALFSLLQVTLRLLPMLVGLVLLFSILLHGLTVMPIMRSLDRPRGRDPDRDDPAADTTA